MTTHLTSPSGDRVHSGPNHASTTAAVTNAAFATATVKTARVGYALAVDKVADIAVHPMKHTEQIHDINGKTGLGKCLHAVEVPLLSSDHTIG